MCCGAFEQVVRDIIQVTADSLRADHCGWQSGAATTPNLDRLARDSLVFETAVAPGPRTLSSVPVSQTGTPFAPNRHGTDSYEDRASRIRSHLERFRTVSQRLREEGYTTVAFTANPWTSTNTDFDAGFDRFHEVGRTGGRLISLFDGTPVEKPAILADRWLSNDTWFSQWRTFYDDIRATLEEVDGPVYVWVFLMDTHNPYIVPRQDRKESSAFGMWAASLRANRVLGTKGDRTAYGSNIDDTTLRRLGQAYRDGVRSVDAFVDRLMGDLAEDAVLLFHSDHGEGFGEHGTYGHTPVLYEENLHVPLLVHGTDTDGTVEAPVSTARIPEILLSCAREEPLEAGDLTSGHAVARTESDDAIALRGERWKYVRREDEERLYDLQADSGETSDVGDENPAVRSEMRGACDEYLDALPEPSVSATVEEDEDVKRHLRSLGYL